MPHLLKSLLVLTLAACGSSSDVETPTTTDSGGDSSIGDADTADVDGTDTASADVTAAEDTAADIGSDSTTQTGIETCEDMAAFFENAPATTSTGDCQLADRTTATCCTFTFASDLAEDGPYCPESTTSPAPYGLSVYDGATGPGLRPFNGAYLLDIEADGYDPMFDADGNTNIVTGLGGAAPDGSNCLAMAQDPDLTITVNIPLSPQMAASPSDIASVENLGVSIYGVPATGEPPSAINGPTNGPGGPGGPGAGGDSSAINVPSLGSCGAHPDPAGYLHDHFVPQVMNRVLAANGIGTDEVECTRYEQRTTGLYGFAKDGFPIYSSRDAEDALPSDLDTCNGHFGATDEFPDGIYHYHADEALAPNYPTCLSGVAVSQSFTYR